MSKNYYWFILILLYFAGPCYAQSGNTGLNARDAVKKIYISQIGIRELTGNNDGKAVETYLKYVYLSKGNPWCAAFVCWVLSQNNIKNPRSGYCPVLFSSSNIIYQRDKKNNLPPLPADIFGIYFTEKSRIAHVGFVESWNAKTVSTVEGNTNQAGSREGDGVYRKIRLTRQIYAVARFIK